MDKKAADQVCNSWFKQKPHDPAAPYDGYDESDDTEEKARSVPLKNNTGSGDAVC